jgi:cyanophycinase
MTSPRKPRGTLALVGGDEFAAASADVHRPLLELSGAQEVVVIPAAAVFEGTDAVVAAATAHFESLGAKVRALEVANRRDADDDAVVRAVKHAKFVYLTDGSPMHLRSVLKDTQLLDVLVAAHRNGAVVAAAGAGATVLCDPMIDPRGGAYTVGLGLVQGITVFAHHRHGADHIWDRAVDLQPASTVLVGIDDHTALVRDADGAWKVTGADSVTVLHRGGAAKRHGSGPIAFD